MIDADAFTPMDGALIVTGEVRDVTGTPFDFRQPTAIGARINADDEQIRMGGGYDHNFVLNGAPGTLRLAARVSEPVSGRVLEVLTTEPGVQFYAGNQMEAASTGKGGTGLSPPRRVLPGDAAFSGCGRTSRISRRLCCGPAKSMRRRLFSAFQPNSRPDSGAKRPTVGVRVPVFDWKRG